MLTLTETARAFPLRGAPLRGAWPRRGAWIAGLLLSAVVAVPAPAGIGLLAAPLLLLTRRRNKQKPGSQE